MPKREPGKESIESYLISQKKNQKNHSLGKTPNVLELYPGVPIRPPPSYPENLFLELSDLFIVAKIFLFAYVSYTKNILW